MALKFFSFPFDVLNYEERPATGKVVVDIEDTEVLGVTAERLLNPHTEEATEVEAFYIAYEGNVYGKKNFTQADWDAAVLAQTPEVE